MKLLCRLNEVADVDSGNYVMKKLNLETRCMPFYALSEAKGIDDKDENKRTNAKVTNKS